MHKFNCENTYEHFETNVESATARTRVPNMFRNSAFNKLLHYIVSLLLCNDLDAGFQSMNYESME